MNRREFNKSVGIAALSIPFAPVILTHRTASSRIAITMDDFTWQNAVHQSATDRSQSILNTLKSHSLKAALFVVGRNVEDEEGKKLLEPWNTNGHLIGNHTYSHRNFNASSMKLETFEQDILHAEELLKGFSGFKRYFRFPMLKEGDTAQKRDGLRNFLDSHDYRTGHVTIDNSDWIVDQRLTARLKSQPEADVKPYRDFYLEHMWDRAQYYDSLAKRVVGRTVNNTILMHFNLLNGLFLDELIRMFKGKGWGIIDAEEAFSDPVFMSKPKILPAGESIIWSLAKANGTIAKSLRYPAEDGDYETARMNKLGL